MMVYVNNSLVKMGNELAVKNMYDICEMFDE